MEFCSWCQTGWCLALPLPGPGPHTCGGKGGPTQEGTQLEVESGKEGLRVEYGVVTSWGFWEGGRSMDSLTWYGAGIGQ